MDCCCFGGQGIFSWFYSSHVQLPATVDDYKPSAPVEITKRKYGFPSIRSELDSIRSTIEEENCTMMQAGSQQPLSTKEIPGALLQQYKFISVIGLGTTSRVYRISRKGHSIGRKPADGSMTSRANNVLLACKLISKIKLTAHLDAEDADPLLQQLRREIAILRGLHHPNIVALHDFMETRSKIVIITEYLSGGELFNYIVQHGPLQEDTARHLLRGVFSAVAYIHDRGVTHRDIKAENLIFHCDASGTVQLKLIDFGFSTILRNKLGGSFLGTGGYIAPEIRQSRMYSSSVDNWALGVLLYCTLSASMPFPVSVSMLPRTQEECHNALALKFPARKWGHISDECVDLIQCLLTIDPMCRATAKDTLHRHPWFAKEWDQGTNTTVPCPPLARRSTQQQGQGQQLLSAHAAIDPLLGASTARGRNPEELPLLLSPLRPHWSYSELEKSGQIGYGYTTGREKEKEIMAGQLMPDSTEQTPLLPSMDSAMCRLKQQQQQRPSYWTCRTGELMDGSYHSHPHPHPQPPHLISHVPLPAHAHTHVNSHEQLQDSRSLLIDADGEEYGGIMC